MATGIGIAVALVASFFMGKLYERVGWNRVLRAASICPQTSRDGVTITVRCRGES